METKLNSTVTNLPRSACVELQKGTHRLKLRLRLVPSNAGGPLVAIDPEAVLSIKPATKSTLNYTMDNWMSGLMSGAIYASRKLKLSDRRVFVANFEGRLGGADMGIVANATVIAMAVLAGGECPPLELEGWSGQSSVVDANCSASETRDIPAVPGVLTA